MINCWRYNNTEIRLGLRSNSKKCIIVKYSNRKEYKHEFIKNESGSATWHLKVIAYHYKNLLMDYEDHTQDKIITRYNSCIKEKQDHDYNHFKAAILHKEKQSAYMPCQYHLSPWLELLSSSLLPLIFLQWNIYI